MLSSSLAEMTITIKNSFCGKKKLFIASNFHLWLLRWFVSMWRHDTRQNDILHNDIWHNCIVHNALLSVFVLNGVMSSAVLTNVVAPKANRTKFSESYTRGLKPSFRTEAQALSQL
jgi:hypothetical protein